MTHLSLTAKQEIFDWVLEDVTMIMNQMMFKLSVLLPQSLQSLPLLPIVTAMDLQEKEEKSTLMELIGDKFQSENEQTTDTTTFKDIVYSELLHYKTEPSISVYHPPLHWWSVRRHLYPNVSKLARKYLCVVATSVPSEQLFSKAGNVVFVKCAALLPENVEKLIFLHDNLPPVSLAYRCCVQDEACDCVGTIE